MLSAQNLSPHITKEQRLLPNHASLNKYEIIRIMGEGSNTMVYEAFDKVAQESVAIKIVARDGLHHSQEEQVLREIALLRRFSHPHIVRFLTFVDTPTHICIVLELLSSGELFGKLRDMRCGLPESAARHVIKQIACAVKYLHDRGTVHRDIKLENILYQPSTESVNSIAYSDARDAAVLGIGMVKLCDFGLSKEIFDATTQTPCGTIGYTAPEILQDQQYHFEVDIWALGCVMYTVLCGFLPFSDGDSGRLTDKITRCEYTFIQPFWEHVSPQAKDLISQCLKVPSSARPTIDQFMAHPWFSIDAARTGGTLHNPLAINDNRSTDIRALPPTSRPLPQPLTRQISPLNQIYPRTDIRSIPALARVAGLGASKPPPHRTVRRVPMKAAQIGGQWPTLPDVLRTPITEDLPILLNTPDVICPEVVNGGMVGILNQDTSDNTSSSESREREGSPVSPSVELSRLSLDTTPRPPAARPPVAPVSSGLVGATPANPRRLAQVVYEPLAPVRLSKRSASDLSASSSQDDEVTSNDSINMNISMDDNYNMDSESDSSDSDDDQNARRVRARASWTIAPIVDAPASVNASAADTVAQAMFGQNQVSNALISAFPPRRARARTASSHKVLFNEPQSSAVGNSGMSVGSDWSRLRTTSVPSLITAQELPPVDLQNREAWAAIQRRMNNAPKAPTMAVSLDDIGEDFVSAPPPVVDTEEDASQTPRPHLPSVKWNETVSVLGSTPSDWDASRRRRHTVQHPWAPPRVMSDISREVGGDDYDLDESSMTSMPPMPIMPPLEWLPRRNSSNSGKSFTAATTTAPAPIAAAAGPSESMNPANVIPTHLRQPRARARTTSVNRVLFRNNPMSALWKDPVTGNAEMNGGTSPGLNSSGFSSSSSSARSRAKSYGVPSLIPVEEEEQPVMSLDDVDGWAAMQARLNAGRNRGDANNNRNNININNNLNIISLNSNWDRKISVNNNSNDNNIKDASNHVGGATVMANANSPPPVHKSSPPSVDSIVKNNNNKPGIHPAPLASPPSVKLEVASEGRFALQLGNSTILSRRRRETHD
ncbi:hypothetical protein SmJEL517_g00811 [Synchytrium microbalum]|uniref:Protein kinase domain-containing protein n=1 Tax=Synchytrium microbalum TaxID=1806994 RepID=A0A507CHQ2_9FUNG|nr:uncharacterized protein SmJEL517_g00811 [Synchytrium microbalum]TPX37195.1 hypothetical protein SmJEL517_g00811 [Synchytrium microbalum]